MAANESIPKAQRGLAQDVWLHIAPRSLSLSLWALETALLARSSRDRWSWRRRGFPPVSAAFHRSSARLDPLESHDGGGGTQSLGKPTLTVGVGLSEDAWDGDTPHVPEPPQAEGLRFQTWCLAQRICIYKGASSRFCPHMQVKQKKHWEACGALGVSSQGAP